MICPFCQHELNVDAGFCPNCAAETRTHVGMPFGVKLRMLLLGGATLLMTVLVLNECVLSNIQSNTIVPECSTFTTGGNCQVQTDMMQLSPQGSQFSGPDMKGPELQQLLLMWQSGQQPTQNNPYSRPAKTPTR